MTVKVLEDGTRVYSNRTKYTPVPVEQRKNFARKPDDPRAVRWKGDWLLPLTLLDEDERTLPETRPDTVAYDHMMKGRCRCAVCKRPEARRWKRMYLRQMRSESSASA